MNYYQRFVADFAAKTGHLTLAEVGAYDRLLDHYYSGEKPIDPKRVYSVTRCQTAADRAATDAVLTEFWTLTADGWVQDRAAEVIGEARPRIEAARSNGKRGGRPKKNPPGIVEEPTGFSEETQQEPRSKAPHTPYPKERSSTDVEALSGERPAVRVCVALRKAGIADCNASHPMLTTLVNAGATVDEFVASVGKARGRSNPFAYLLAIVESERKRAAEAAASLHQGPMPTRPPTAAEMRMLEACPGLAAPHLRPTRPPITATIIEADDVPSKLLG